MQRRDNFSIRKQKTGSRKEGTHSENATASAISIEQRTKRKNEKKFHRAKKRRKKNKNIRATIEKRKPKKKDKTKKKKIIFKTRFKIIYNNITRTP